MVRMQLVTEIEWDCDDADEPLPERMFVPLSLDEEDIADYLSDTTGSVSYTHLRAHET